MGSIEIQTRDALEALMKATSLQREHVLVVGVSTSEVLGERIGTCGNEEVASLLYHEFKKMSEKRGFHLAFQCCEHLNRALVVEQETAKAFSYTEVVAVPVSKAGGAMAAFAFRHFENPVLVEEVQADAGIDIGDTLIGMHLKPVAVPVRPPTPYIGHAHVTMAITRPKLIGGERAIYQGEREW